MYNYTKAGKIFARVIAFMDTDNTSSEFLQQERRAFMRALTRGGDVSGVLTFLLDTVDDINRIGGDARTECEILRLFADITAFEN